MTYLQELGRELSRVGVRGRLRRRILTEIGDHLACDPDAALGQPAELARQFADELGTSRARRAALAVFAALAIAGTLFAIAFVTSLAAGLTFPHLHERSTLLGDLATVLAVLSPQVALVAGVFGAIRALRRRHEVAVPRSEAVAISRRAAVGHLAGLASMAGLALVAIEYERGVPGWWTTLALTVAAAGGCALAAATPAVLSALRLRPTGAGRAGDLFDDVGPLLPSPLRGRPWTLALLVAGAVWSIVTLAGVLQADGIDGALRGLADALACLAGFATLGRYLGLHGT